MNPTKNRHRLSVGLGLIAAWILAPFLPSQCELTRLGLPGAGPIGLFHEGDPIAVSRDGSTVVMGLELDDTGGINTGATQVFTRSGNQWITESILYAPDAAENDQFGRAVALSGDGNTLLVGAWLDDDQSMNSGSAYVFVRQAGVWNFEEKLTALGGEKDGHFGVTVALSGDGDLALIGAPLRNGAQVDSGSAYLFKRESNGWAQEFRFDDPGLAMDDQFGISVDLADEGHIAIIGAWRDNEVGADAGAAYIYAEGAQGWALEQKLLPDSNVSVNSFAYNVSLSGDGLLCAVGAPLELAANSTGAVYLFRRNGAQWLKDGKLQISGSTIEAPFGFALDVSEQGSRVAASQILSFDSASPGTAFLFEVETNQWKLAAAVHPNEPALQTSFGDKIAISGDAMSLFVMGEQADFSRTIHAFSLTASCPQLSLLAPQPSIAGIPNSLTALWPVKDTQVYFAWSFLPGLTAVPGCPGLQSDLATPIPLGAATVTEYGGATLQKLIPSSARGLTIQIQALLPVNCKVSNVSQAFLR